MTGDRNKSRFLLYQLKLSIEYKKKTKSQVNLKETLSQVNNGNLGLLFTAAILCAILNSTIADFGRAKDECKT